MLHSLLLMLSDYTCDIFNITYKHPLKCLLINLIEDNKKRSEFDDFLIFLNFFYFVVNCDCLHENCDCLHDSANVIEDLKLMSCMSNMNILCNIEEIMHFSENTDFTSDPE